MPAVGRARSRMVYDGRANPIINTQIAFKVSISRDLASPTAAASEIPIASNIWMGGCGITVPSTLPSRYRGLWEMNMKQMTFGRRTGLRVSEFGLGTGGFGTQYCSLDDSRAIVDRFAEAGGTLIDTADSYADGESEAVLGEILAGQRENFVLASKFSRGNGAQMPISRVGNSRRSMFYAVDQSLRRLKTDWIDLYWAHFDDRVTPMDEIVAGFDELIASGKIRYGGVSNFPAWRTALGQSYADSRGLATLAGVQVEHSLIERGAETEVLPMAESLGLGVALYSPLGGGLLTAKHRRGRENRPVVVHREDSETKKNTIDEIEAVALEVGAPPSEVAIAWQRSFNARPQTNFVTIIGPRSTEQLDGNLRALGLRLDEEHVTRLNAASQIYHGAPHDGIGGPPDLGDLARLGS